MSSLVLILPLSCCSSFADLWNPADSFFSHHPFVPGIHLQPYHLCTLIPYLLNLLYHVICLSFHFGKSVGDFLALVLACCLFLFPPQDVSDNINIMANSMVKCLLTLDLHTFITSVILFPTADFDVTYLNINYLYSRSFLYCAY